MAESSSLPTDTWTTPTSSRSGSNVIFSLPGPHPPSAHPQRGVAHTVLLISSDPEHLSLGFPVTGLCTCCQDNAGDLWDRRSHSLYPQPLSDGLLQDVNDQMDEWIVGHSLQAAFTSPHPTRTLGGGTVLGLLFPF